jgi:uncharacterized membrane protein (DUF2068 family)
MRKAGAVGPPDTPAGNRAALPGPLPRTVPGSTPGTIARKRYRPRIDYELLSCGFQGHDLVGTQAAAVRPEDSDVVRELDGLRWHRCLRCDAWIVLEVPTEPTEDHPPDLSEIKVPLRGRRLRDRYVLRLIVLDRLFHALVLGLLAAAIFIFAQHASILKSRWEKILRVLQSNSGSWYVRDLNHLFSLRPATLYFLGLAAAAYTALLLVEAFGLWSARRWAEYLTFAELATLVPVEIYELSSSITVLKMFTLVVNLAILLYLLIAHRLFGVRGGVKAAKAAYGEEG